MKYLDDKITEIYFEVDEFCNAFCKFLHSKSLGKTPKRVPFMSTAKICTITILFHFRKFKSFKYYYFLAVRQGVLKKYFPHAVSYNRYIEPLPRCLIYLYAFLKCEQCVKGDGVLYLDSKKLTVCHNRRIHSHKVFENIAQRGHCSVGYFFGFKLFVVLDHKGQLVNFQLTPGNQADNNTDFMVRFLKDLHGKVFADKGFINAKAWEQLLDQGVQVITKLRSNMKNKLMALEDKLFLSKRGMIESAFNLMITLCDVEHSIHRKSASAFCATNCALIAFTYLDNLLSILDNYATFLGT
ncbi:MAG: IS982 family transposase [Saprospiraceae bacterium]|nr:IS982 family transposase [Saprospiraceae bacterium]